MVDGTHETSADVAIPIEPPMTAGSGRLWSDVIGEGIEGVGTDAPPVVLLAPGARPARYFSPEWSDRVASGTGSRIVRIDLPGQGRSVDVDGPLVLDGIVAAVHTTLLGANADRFHLVGVGVSGVIALGLAALAPRLCASLSLVSTSAYVADPALPGADEMLVASISIRQDTSTPEAVFGTLLNHERRLGGITDADEVKAWVEWGVDPSERYRRLFLTLEVDDRQLASITTPTLVVHGDADPMIPPDHAEHLANALPNARLALIPEMGHGLSTDHQATIADHLTTHITRHA